jgi:hypothetical protein
LNEIPTIQPVTTKKEGKGNEVEAEENGQSEN